MTTATLLYSTLTGITVTGVNRVFGYEPDSVTTADLPALYVTLPGMEAGRLSDWAAVCADASKRFTASVVILVEAAGQNVTARNFAGVITYIDRLINALDSVAVGIYQDYSIRAGVVDKNGTPYWAVLAEFTAMG